MTKLFFLVLTVLTLGPLPLAAQKLYLYPTAVTAPRGSYQTVTAIVTGVNDKSVTWTASGGTLIGGNPCVVNEPCTIALFSTQPGTIRLKATSNATHAVAAESVVTFTASPTPVRSHPRLIVTEAMLPGLRAKAVPGNVLYGSLKTRAEAALGRDNPVWSWSCKGGSGLPSANLSDGYKENDANLFAFLSMVAPTAAERGTWGCYGRDVWVYVMNQVLTHKETVQGNHWSDSSLSFTLTTDWLLAGGYLTAADQDLARRFLATMATTVLGYSYGTTPGVANYNSSGQFDEHKPFDLVSMRAMGNNYTMSKMLYTAAVALTFNDDPSDDPPLRNTCSAGRYVVCPDYTAGSLHAYWKYFTGAMLYRMYAHLEDPTVSWRAYQAAYSNLPRQPRCIYTDGTPQSCFGDGRGGESSEGSWYQYSMFRLRDAFNMVHTAGYDDPMLYGPQISLGTSSWWDLKYVSDLLFLTGFGPNGQPDKPGYNYFTTGDSYGYVRAPSDFTTEATMLTADAYVGRRDRSDALRWGILNAAFGGPTGKSGGCTQYCGFDGELVNDFASSLGLDLMIALPAGDPVASLPPDPRPSLPSDWFNGSMNQHAILRTPTGSDKTLFSIYCPNTLIDHEHEFCGRFDLFSDGEYITKGRTEFNDYNNRMSSSSQSNMLSMKNITGTGCATDSCEVYNSVVDGGQFWHGEQQGFNQMVHAELPGYAAYLFSDAPAYNGWWADHDHFDVASYNDITRASRSLVYLRKQNQIIFYDRGTSRHPAQKAVYLITTGGPTLANGQATWLTRSDKQRAFFTSLLPEHAAFGKADWIFGGVDQRLDWEPAANLEVNAGSPLSAQFLSVLEWGGAAGKRSDTSLVRSSEGQRFEGAKVGDSVVMFMRDWPTAFAGASYPASGGTTQYVSDLLPNGNYLVQGEGTPASVTADSAGVLVFPATGSGSIRITPKR